jgi:hypothetical protein
MAMTRIFKHYELNLGLEGVASRKLSFSSYPGADAHAQCPLLTWPGCSVHVLL